MPPSFLLFKTFFYQFTFPGFPPILKINLDNSLLLETFVLFETILFNEPTVFVRISNRPVNIIWPQQENNRSELQEEPELVGREEEVYDNDSDILDT